MWGVKVPGAMCGQEEFDAAMAQARVAAEGLRGRLGPDHPYTLAAALMHASLLAQRSDLDQAGALEEQVTSKRARTLGPRHPDTLRARVNNPQTPPDPGDASASGD